MTAIRHIVMFTFRESAQNHEIAKAFLAMEELLRTQRHGIRSWMGHDLGLASGNASAVIVIDFPDAQAFSDFQVSDEHVETLRRIRPVIASRSAVQSAVEDSHGLLPEEQVARRAC